MRLVQYAAVLVPLMFSQPILAEAAGSSDKVARAESKLKTAFGPDMQVTDVVPMAGGQMMEVQIIDGSTIHMTPDLNYFFYRDELYQLAPTGVVNVSEQRKLPIRANKMAGIKDTEAVVFGAKGVEKATINIFTDIDCGYCQKMHQEVPRLNELGIKVRYLAYPRAGIKDRNSGSLTGSYKKINYVWCQGDRKVAMTEMKSSQQSLNRLGRQLGQSSSAVAQSEYQSLQTKMSKMMAASKDCNAPIADQYALGQQLGVSGTPAIIVDDGTLIPGYVPADELAKRLGIL